MSGVSNNGSGLSGLNANTLFYNLTISLAMLAGYLISTISALAIAGSLVKKNSSPLGTRFPTSGFVFILVLACTIVIMSALTFFPTLALGPILEHLQFFAV